MEIKMFESFSGIGSFSIALKNLGIDFDIVGISEVDRYAILGYDAIHNEQIDVEEVSKDDMIKYIKDRNICYNFSTGESEIPNKYEDIKKVYSASVRCNNYGDIRLIDYYNLPYFDLFTYSFPCKNISVNGKQAGFKKDSGTQSSLVWNCSGIIEYNKPKFLVMENVKNIVGKKHKPVFNEWLEYLSEQGYTNYWKVLDCSDYEIPQHRERVIMISIRNDINKGFTFPEPKPLTTFVKDYLEYDFDKKYILKQEWQDSFNKDTMEIESIKYNCKRSVNDARDKCIIQTLMAAMGMGGSNQPKIYYEHNGLSVLRKITPLEAWRLTGYSDSDFYKAKYIGGLCNSKLYERAGRGIAVKMLESIFTELFITQYNQGW